MPQDAQPVGELVVVITHEPFLPWVKLEYNGQSEELDHAAALEWFRIRGVNTDARLDKVNEMINSALNFGRAEVVIANPVLPGIDPGNPQI